MERETERKRSIKIRTVLYFFFEWHELYRKEKGFLLIFPSLFDCGVDSIKNKVTCPNIYKQMVMLSFI